MAKYVTYIRKTNAMQPLKNIVLSFVEVDSHI